MARILIVDDNPSSLKTLSLVLDGRTSAELVSSLSATVALKKFDEAPFDVVISDIKMAGMDGLSFLKEIKKRCHDTPVILTTAYEETQYLMEGLRAGAYDFIRKPFDVEYLVASVTRALNHAQAFHEVENRRKVNDARAAELQRLRDLRANIGVLLASRQSLDVILHECAQQIVTQLDMAFARVWTLDDAAETLVLRASAGLYTHLDGGHSRVKMGEFKIGRIALSKKPHVSNTVLTDPEVGDKEWAAREGMVAFAGYPLLLEDKIFGVLAMFSRKPISEGVVQDLELICDGITQWVARKQVEEKLEERNEWLHVTLKSIGDAVIATDIHGHVTFMNPVAQNMTGWQPQEALGRSIHAIFNIVKETTDAPVENPIDIVLRENRVVALANHTVVISKHGVRTPIEDSAAPIHDGKGALIGAVMVFYDVSERRSREKERDDLLKRERESRVTAQAAEGKLSFLAESLPQKIFTAKPTGEVDYFNRQWMEFTGLSFEVIRDWGWKQFMHPDDLEDTVRLWMHAVTTGEPYKQEHRFRRHDGVYHWHLSRAHAMRDTDGKIVMWLGSNTDIQDQRKVAEDLIEAKNKAEAADRAKDQFFATLSHELRSPLTPMLGWTRMLLAGNLDAATQAQGLRVIERNVHAQAKLIEDILDMSRVITGKLALNVRPLDLADVVRSAVEVVRPAAAAKQISIDLVLPPDVAEISGDGDRLQQVFWNLLTNAVKFTPAHGNIRIRLAKAASNFEITVSDSGVGMKADFIPHVFERFSQADSTSNNIHGGLGIGLSLVKNLVEQHGGHVTAESAGEGQGSTFTVTLPERAPGVSENAKALTAKKEKMSRTLAGAKVLIVDDEQDSRELITFALRCSGAIVHSAASAQEALENYHESRPDVIVSDIGMPNEDGFAFVTRLKSLEADRGTSTPVLALTAFASSSDQLRCKEAGFRMHLAKPIDPSDLVKAVASLWHPANP